nr:D-alanyl-D-alanine carboxypeptidase family protein [Ancylobacter lacus]
MVAPARAQATPSLLIDVESGKVLEAEDAGKPWYPASVTKLMTAYVTFEAIRSGRVTGDTLITVSPFAASQAPSKMGFKPGTQITIDNALKMMLVKSANDIAVVLAEGIGGTLPAFVDQMNAAARELGMDGTHFSNPNGLPDPDNVTTARDLAILARAIILQYPEHEQIFRLPGIKIGNRVIRNYNKLIDRYPGADGMKTGFICASGFNLVASAHRGDRRVLAVVLGTPSGKARTEAAALLMEKGFQQSWSIFGKVAPSVESIKNEGGPPTDMKAYVCGAKRKTVASEDDDSPSPTGFAAAGMGSLPPGTTGASLLSELPPSMPPAPVWVGPTPDDAALAAAYAVEPAPKKPAAKGKKSTVVGSKTVGTQPTGVIDPSATGPDGVEIAPAGSAAATPAAKPAKPAAKSSAKPAAQAAKPAAKPATQAAKPAAKPAPKSTVSANDPWSGITATPPAKPATSAAKPKPAPKPAAAPAEPAAATSDAN